MKINKNLLSLLSLSAVAVTTITSVYAWYVSTIGIVQDISDNKLAANASYYQSGTGTNDDPYIIANARHLYNLAWLQDLGYYDDKVYYFKLANDIDMSTLKIGDNGQSPIPAIGIDDHPFIGSFNGAGHTIENLYVASNFSSTNCIKPSQSILNTHNQNQTKKTYNTTTNNIISNYNGLFGIINKYSDDSTSASSSDSKVTNFTIANAKIESSQNTLVGYICGYVNSDLSNVGVANSNLTLATGVTHYSSSYPISKYGLVGDYNNADDGIEWNQNGSDGEDYGTSTDLRGLYEKVRSVDSTLISSNSMVLSKTYAIPFHLDSSSKKIASDNSSLTVTSSNNNIKATSASTISVASTGTNIGYYSGGEIKIYEDYFDSSKVDFDNMKTAGNSQVSVDSDIKHIDIIKTYLKTTVSSDSNYRKGDTAMVLSGTYFGDGASSAGTSFPSSNDNYLVVKNAKVGSWSGNLFIPARGIWVAPTKPGRFEFVAINTKTTGFITNASISVFRLKRSTPKDYSTGFSNGKYVQGNDFTNDMCGCIIYGGSNAYVPYYYGVDISQEDIDNGYEFFITKYASDSNNPYIVYLDIGTTGDSGSDTSYIGTIKDIDFTYVSTTGYALVDTDNGFTLSNVYFNIDGTTTKEVALYVMRSIQTGNLVYYYFISDGGLTNKVTGNATSKDSIDDLNKVDN